MTATTEWSPAIGGACSSAGHRVDFFPNLHNEDAEVPVPSEIKYLCNVVCPFGRDGSCLKWAMNNDAYGFWAGTSRYQRLQLGRDRHRAKCPGCRSTAIITLGRGEICTSCGTSWMIA